MKNYQENNNMFIIELTSGKNVKVSSKWVYMTADKLNISIPETLELYLTDHDLLKNEEQEKLDKEAKGKVKLVVSTDKPKAKTQKERTSKENPNKEYIINNLAAYLQELKATNIIIEKKAKLITFTYNDKEFKLDLTEKRQAKA